MRLHRVTTGVRISDGQPVRTTELKVGKYRVWFHKRGVHVMRPWKRGSWHSKAIVWWPHTQDDA